MIVTSKELIDKSIELFIKYGYKNVTIDMICKEFNVTKGSFYHHFKSKDELLINWFNSLIEKHEVNDNNQSLNSYEELKLFYYNWAKKLEEIGPSLLKEALTSILNQSENLNANPLTFNQLEMKPDYLISLITHAQKDEYIPSDLSPQQLISLSSYGIAGLCINWTIEKNRIHFIDEFMNIFNLVFKKQK